jgi:SpoVK/Ycf46/Vps4 family AAA+-type ATPase
MDDSTLAGLRAALQASPDNAALLDLISRALWERRDVDGLSSLLGGRESLPPGPQLLLARALLTRGDRPAAQLHYTAAVSANRTLEDPELEEALRQPPPPTSLPAGRPHLRLLAAGREEAGEPGVKELVDQREPISFADVGGLGDLKEQIRRKVILPRLKPSLFERFRKKSGGGVLLYGPPGCGKTMMARATAGECKATFINVAISDVLDMYLGESEQKLRAIFEKARSSSPAVLFFDEVEALGGKRNYKTSGAAAAVVSQFLSEMDGYASRNDGVLILGATNVPWAVDPAFRRPGRFDRVIFVPPPDREARQSILQLHLKERPLAGDVDLASLARRTGGYSGADLENLVETAADMAIARSLETNDEQPIRMAELEQALQELRPTTSEWLTTARNYARYSNESGQYDEVLAFLEKNGRS